MAVNYKMYFDAAGIARADFGDFPDPGRLVADFLDGDIGSNLAICQEYVSQCKQVTHGKKREAELTGNAFTVALRKDRVELFHNFLDETKFPVEMQLPPEQFLSILEDWKKLLETHDVQEGELVLEYVKN